MWYLSPLTTLLAHLTGSVIFISRHNNDREALYSKCLKEIGNGKTLVLYPEGTRSQTRSVNRLRTGFLIFAFDNKLPVQLLITKGKEDPLNFGNEASNFMLETDVSPVIDPSNFGSFEDFYEEIKIKWADIWFALYGPDDQDPPPTQPT
jgi:1-acyl-sn-glycerol-3-phosphate acyltransferase